MPSSVTPAVRDEVGLGGRQILNECERLYGVMQELLVSTRRINDVFRQNGKLHFIYLIEVNYA